MTPRERVANWIGSSIAIGLIVVIYAVVITVAVLAATWRD